MNSTINFSEYTSRIEKLLHDAYGFSSLNAKIAIICSSDFLPKCYVDGWSAAFVAQMLSIEI